MGAALLLALALAGGGRFERVNSRTEQGRSDRGLMSSSGALFEFAPASGAGMGTACACAAVTGAKGEALTFSRASVGSCIKGSTTALTNGDMVICASGQPRVMPGGDGTSGLGLLVEGSGTNVVTRSEALDNAAFADYTAGGAVAPVVTADAATSPTGTATADMLSLPATAAGEGSGRSIAVLTAAAYSAQAYVLGVTGTGVVDLCVETSTGGTCAPCNFSTSAWTPCVVQNVTSVAGGRVIVGNLSDLNGGDSRDAVDVLVWGLDAKLGAVATSYVPTAGSAVARVAESVVLPAPPGITTATSFSVGEWFRGPSAATFVPLDVVSGAGARIFAYTSTLTINRVVDGVGGYGDAYAAVGADAWKTAGVRWALSWVPSSGTTGVITGYVNGVAGTPSGSIALNATPRAYGQIVLNGDGVHKQVCVDSSPTRCK